MDCSNDVLWRIFIAVIALNWSKRRATCNTHITWSPLRLYFDMTVHAYGYFLYYNNFKFIFTSHQKTPDPITIISDLIFSSHAAGKKCKNNCMILAIENVGHETYNGHWIVIIIAGHSVISSSGKCIWKKYFFPGWKLN